MKDKKKADQQASPKETHLDNTSGQAQRTRLACYQQHMSKTRSMESNGGEQ